MTSYYSWSSMCFFFIYNYPMIPIINITYRFQEKTPKIVHLRIGAHLSVWSDSRQLAYSINVKQKSDRYIQKENRLRQQATISKKKIPSGIARKPPCKTSQLLNVFGAPARPNRSVCSDTNKRNFVIILLYKQDGLQCPCYV